jgi:predicted Zn-dependent protease
MAALALSKSRDVQYGAALALALAGDTSRAQALTDDLEKRFPEDTTVSLSYAPVLRAILAGNERKREADDSKAIELLRPAVPYELGSVSSSVFGFFGNLYPAFVRGNAHLAAGKGLEASQAFQKVLDHPGIVFNDPIGALTRLQLGRALALSGDKVRAKAAYQSFLTLWKDADPEIPILQQARAEAAKL